MNDEPEQTPSLLDREATGGDIAEGGFAFQDGITVGNIPRWLACDGFQSLLREGLGDIEAAFYVPGIGIQMEFTEVKNHQVTPAEFWKEIERFQTLHATAGSDYRRFNLIAHSFSATISPIKNALSRIRNPGAFYAPNEAVTAQSYSDYVEAVKKEGRSEADAKFLFDLVDLIDEQGVASEAGKALFLDRVGVLPPLSRVSHGSLTTAFNSLLELVRSRRNKIISRMELEARLLNAIPEGERPAPLVVTIFTAAEEDAVPPGGLTLDWRAFTGSGSRSFPAASEWNDIVGRQAEELASWVRANRESRRICLRGRRRLSAALSLGRAFSAVAGFELEMEVEDCTWSVSKHPSASAPAYELTSTFADRGPGDIVVDIGICRDIQSSVTDAVPTLNLDGLSRLSIHGADAVQSNEQLANVVRSLKQALTERTQSHGPRIVHLFFAGPSVLALALGHRINATAIIQAYEWVGTNQYVPTVLIRT